MPDQPSNKSQLRQTTSTSSRTSVLLITKLEITNTQINSPLKILSQYAIRCYLLLSPSLSFLPISLSFPPTHIIYTTVLQKGFPQRSKFGGYQKNARSCLLASGVKRTKREVKALQSCHSFSLSVFAHFSSVCVLCLWVYMLFGNAPLVC